MGLLSRIFLNEAKKDKTEVLDASSLDANSGDAIVVTGQGQTNNLQFYQYERSNTDSQKINTYRQLSKNAEIDEVVADIVNESFIFQRDKRAFELDWLPNTTLSDVLKDMIYEEFKNIYSILNFDDIGSELFYSFYVDGRLSFQKVKHTNSRQGLSKIIPLDVMNVVKVKIIPLRNRQTQMINADEIKEFYVYSNSKVSNKKSYLNNIYSSENDVSEQGVKLSTDSVTYVTSGLTDEDGNTIGWLDKSIVPFNNLKMMEQSMVIFRVVRSPMRRAFYIDVSSLPRSRAEEYMANMSQRFKSKLVYNADTGSWVDQRSVISMTEDYFIPRFNDSKTTEIQNIEGQSSQEILDEVNYMRDKLYQSLSAPKSRYTEEGNIFLFGKTDQIPRDEYRFKKFIDKVRNRFMLSIDDILRTQLILKGIITAKDWEEVKNAYFWNFTEDNAFIEYKDSELMDNRIETASKMVDLIESGYYSKTWVKKNILRQTDEEIEQIEKEIFIEKNQDPDNLPDNDNMQPDPSAEQDIPPDNQDAEPSVTNDDDTDDTGDNPDTNIPPEVT